MTTYFKNPKLWSTRSVLIAALAVVTLIGLAAWLGAGSSQATSSAQSITASTNSTCVVTTANGVKCWGSLYNTNYGDYPADVPGLTSGINAVDAGAEHTCALTSGGGVKCWGFNAAGQLGDGTTTSSNTPVNVSGLTGVTAISAGYEHTCAILAGGDLRCWGHNQFGALGNNSTTDSTVPVSVTGMGAGVAAVAAGFDHTCALMTTGGVKCWGYNNSGQVGDNSVTTRLTPVDVSGLTGVSSISAGTLESCAVTIGGGVDCWGTNGKGSLGINTDVGPDSCGGSACAKTPQTVFGLSSGVSQVAVGAFDACARTILDVVKCWGWNQAGQLGDGTDSGPDLCGGLACSTAPVLVPGVSAVGMAAGWYHSCGLNGSGGVECWGWNLGGPLGNGTSTGPELCSFGAYVNVACSTAPVTTLLLGPVKPPATPTAMPVSCPISPNQAFPNPGCEVVDVSGTLTADVTSPVPGTFTCPLSGPMQVARYQNPSDPHDGDNDTRRDTDVEILYMNLVGLCSPGAFPIIIRQDPAHQSLGTIEEETANDPDFFPADAVLNVYGQIRDIQHARTLHTDSAVSMECLGITAVPVTGCTFSFVGSLAGQEAGELAGAPPPVAVFDETDTQVGEVTDASITPNTLDTDLDGCSDTREAQTASGSQTTGGRRSGTNFWDYADMPNGNGFRDRRLRVDDILRVVSRYFANDAGATATVNRYSDPLVRPPGVGYHPAFDRTGAGPNAWNLGPPDGQITVSDILSVVYQYFHDCA